MALLDVDGVTVRFGGVVALRDLTFSIEEGQILGLIGPNGAGKTTLFNVVSRIYAPSEGSIHFEGHNLLDHPAHQISALGVYRTFQNLALWPNMSVLENVMTGAHAKRTQNVFTAMVNWGRVKEERELEWEAYSLLGDLGVADVALEQCAGLPYGTMKRIELARALMGKPKLLMLDEPATGLTHSEVSSLADLITEIRERYDLTILLVEHHMGMVMSISDRVVVLDFGSKLAEGTPKQVREDPQVIAAYLGSPS